jgi:serine/threonine-protein kinase RsbT
LAASCNAWAACSACRSPIARGRQGDLITAAISELARNILHYAGQGWMEMLTIGPGAGRMGIGIIAADHGPGIADVERAMQDGFTSGSGRVSAYPGHGG